MIKTFDNRHGIFKIISEQADDRPSAITIYAHNTKHVTIYFSESDEELLEQGREITIKICNGFEIMIDGSEWWPND